MNKPTSVYRQEDDYEAYLERQAELMKTHKDQCVVIHKRKVIRFFDTVSEAFDFGMNEFGAEKFIAQEIMDEEITPISYSLLV